MRLNIVVPLALLVGFAVLIETVSNSDLRSFECPKCPDCPKWCPACRQCPNRCASCMVCQSTYIYCHPCPTDPDEYCKKKVTELFKQQDKLKYTPSFEPYMDDHPGLRDRCERLHALDSMGTEILPGWSIWEETSLRKRCKAMEVNEPIDPDFQFDVCPACPVCPKNCPPCEKCRTDCEGCPTSRPCPPDCPCPKLSKDELDNYCKKRVIELLGKHSRKFEMPTPGPSLYDPDYVRLERIELCRSWLGDLKDVEDPEESETDGYK